MSPAVRRPVRMCCTTEIRELKEEVERLKGENARLREQVERPPSAPPLEPPADISWMKFEDVTRMNPPDGTA